MKKQTRSYRRGNGGRPEDVALAYINSNSDQPGLEERYISEYIGKGVFATREFKSGHFLLQYKGELVSAEEGERREKQYSLDFGNFLYFFQWNEATYCIDATFSHGLGRLVNDLPAKKANCKMKKVIVSGKVCLCLFATKDIAPNEELRYDYGLKDLPWRVKSGDGSDNMNKNWKNSTTRKDGAVISQDCEEVVCAKEDSCKGDLSDNRNENRKNCATGEGGAVTSQDCEEVAFGKEDSSKGSVYQPLLYCLDGRHVISGRAGDVRDNINKNWKNSTTCEDGAVMSQDCEEVVCAKEDSCKGDRSGNINENWKNYTRCKVEEGVPKIQAYIHGPHKSAFVNDILVASSSRDEHLQHLRALFQHLFAHGLVINPTKCEFGKPEVTFLSHTINADGSRPHIARVEAVRTFPVPQDKKALHQFVGLINYYHCFVPRCAELLQPLHQALAADSFTWNTSCQQAFDAAKRTLSEAVMLVHPRPNAATCITTDASNLVVGALPEQFTDGQWKPTSLFSKKLSPA